VVYDGTIVPGGVLRVKKGDQLWSIVEQARRMGAEGGRKGWARISVDDLMLVRGDIIVPHHYALFHFISNKTVGYDGQLLFDYSVDKTEATPDLEEELEEEYDPLNPKKQSKTSQIALQQLEGYTKEAELVKIVDRRWYLKNSHIFPATLWEEFDNSKDYSTEQRKDALGNGLFFS
jgi:protein FAM50